MECGVRLSVVGARGLLDRRGCVGGASGVDGGGMTCAWWMTGGVFRKGPLSETYGTGLPMGGSVAVAGRSDVGPRHRERGVCEETRCRRVGHAPGRKNGLKPSLLGWNMLEEAQFLCYGPCGLFSHFSHIFIPKFLIFSFFTYFYP